MFLSGSIDGKLRLWNVPDQRVMDWADLHEMVTAACFNRDGSRAIVGTMKGQCRFYNCEGARLEYTAQIDVRNLRKGSRGKKITGLCFQPVSADQAGGSGDGPRGERLLITSNDSRVRLYEGFVQRAKFKGHKNANSQIKASFSSHGEFLICGSDDGQVFLWSTSPAGSSGARSLPINPYSALKRDKIYSYESFPVSNALSPMSCTSTGRGRFGMGPKR